jgi:hypothetical protein
MPKAAAKAAAGARNRKMGRTQLRKHRLRYPDHNTNSGEEQNDEKNCQNQGHYFCCLSGDLTSDELTDEVKTRP